MNYLFGLIGIIDAQIIQGRITDLTSHQPIEGVTVYLMPNNIYTATDRAGHFIFRPVQNVNNLMCSAIGYQSKTISVAEFQNSQYHIFLSPASIELSAVTVSPHAGKQVQTISKIDMALRDISNSQEVLRLVPGLFIGQHQGGGKAEQIFLRGFDCDHGTDISINADNLPVNMVSHAHGQGYADSHFIIPETIGAVNFNKGPYYAQMGDFCTTGYVDYNTLNSLPYNIVKMEGGVFNTFRFLGMFNMLNEEAKKKQQSLYTAMEYRYTDSYFDNPQHFKRFNVFTKYDGRISKNTWLDLSASALYSRWNASGQIPGRAVSEGIIGFYGALDPNEGGVTSRVNVNAQASTTLHNSDVIKNQLYYSYNTFDLHTNFTFYVIDTVNGDEIRQKEVRSMFGYKGSYQHTGYAGSVILQSEGGIQVRGDAITHSTLSHTANRYNLLNNIKMGNISEISTSAYLNETLRLNDRFSINAGLRLDQFYYGYDNELASDASYPGTSLYKVNDRSLGPKLSFYFNQNENLQFYLSLGKGFHSNDARSVAAVKGNLSLPAAYGADLGAVFKPLNNLIVHSAIWYISLDQENVYGGDGGTIEFSGKTKRVGFDLSARYQPLHNLYLDLDLNYSHGRTANVPKGQNYIPLAPVWTSTGGITYSKQHGFNGSLRYRYMSDRPANENYSLTAVGYFVTDLVLNYTKKNYEIGVTINNVFNTKWKETQFDTVTRLKGETIPVDEVCFTPGTPIAARVSFSLFFK